MRYIKPKIAIAKNINLSRDFLAILQVKELRKVIVYMSFGSAQNIIGIAKVSSRCLHSFFAILFLIA